jgi:hypothetical protein
VGLFSRLGRFLVKLLTSHQDDFAFEVEMHGGGECMSNVSVGLYELPSLLFDVDWSKSFGRN